ncbi:hypothetical protein DL98DRAFT_579061 [Cadophora sp. DSE1049]|nr:hypothetical protein DL98DRAFT_579061 [Cadophora sp. DSE1049]
MSAPSLGGRPRNAWTPSRQRQLVRLYTLTRLTKDEIQKVLKGKDFNPSTSDIQKKLRALFPPDYSTDHRKFRPSNDTSMKGVADMDRRTHGPGDDGGKLLADCANKLITARCSIHMRDRTGNTALAIATRRGLRPVAEILLKRGAHVHSRDSMGVGILSRAESTMIEAKNTGDERLYARILSCIMLLIEAGAKAEPTEQDEWMSRSAKKAFARTTISPDTGSSHSSMI